jgi:hypothetical protein
MDLRLKIIVETKPSKRTFDDGCYSGFQGHFVREAIVEHLSQSATQMTGLRANQKVKLNCQWTEISPKDSCMETGLGKAADLNSARRY